MVSNPKISTCSFEETRDNALSFEEELISELQVANALVDGKGVVLLLNKDAQLEVLGAQRGMPSSEADWEDFINEREIYFSENGMGIVEVKKDGFPFPFMLKLPVHCQKDNRIGHIFIGREQKEMPAKEKQIALRTLSDRLGNWLTVGKSEDRNEGFQQLFEYTFDLMAIIDIDNREFIEVNQAFFKQLGFLPDEVRGKEVMKLIHPDDLVKIDELFKISAEAEEGTEINDVHVRVVNKNGSYSHFGGNAVIHGGKSYVVGRNIDQWVKTQEEREWFYEVIELSPDAVAIANEHRDLVYINEAGLELTGISRDQLSADRSSRMELKDFYPEWAFTKLKEEGFPVAFEKGVWTGETALKHVDGEEIPVKQTLQVQKDKEGGIRYLSTICRDLRDIKSSQRQLAKSEERYRALFENSPNAKCVLKQKEIVQVNPRMVELTGASGKEEIQETSLFGHIHPEYHEELKEMFKSIKATGDRPPALEVVMFGEGNAQIEVSLEASILSYEEGTPMIQVSMKDISWRKKTERALLRSQENYVSVTEGIEDALFIVKPLPSGEFECIYVNSAYYQLTRYIREDVIGKKAYEILPKTHAQFVSKKYREAIRKKEMISYEERLELEDGTVKSLFTRLTPQFDEKGQCIKLVGIIRDITEQKRAHEEVKKFSKIAEAVNNGIMLTDEQGVVEWVNNAFETHTGFKLEAIRGENIEDLLKGDYTDRNALVAFRKEVKDKGEAMEELVLYDKEGHPKWFNISVTEVDEIRSEKQCIFIFTDITENKRIEGQLMNAVIETQENERKRFSEDLHDGLGQSLSAAQMNLYILQDVIPPDKKEAFQNVVDLIQRSIQETRVVSHDLMPSELKDFGLKDALENLTDKFNVPGQLHIKMIAEFGDERLNQRLEVGVYRMIQEIVSNAQKHSKATELTVRLFKNGDYLEIRAEDNGAGFEPRTASSRGMGLNNLRKRTRALQGDIQILSEANKGTHIKIILPISN